MAQAYTPGLKRMDLYLVRKSRQLPIPGEVLVKVGDIVSPDTIVAITNLPSAIQRVDAASDLGVIAFGDEEKYSFDIEKYLRVKSGEAVKKGQIIGSSKSFFGLVKKECVSPIDGTFESFSDRTGKVTLRHPPIPLELTAHISGTVTEVTPKVGVIIDTYAAFIQGIFGIGGETQGKLKIITQSPQIPLTADVITKDFAGYVVVGGSVVTLDALKKAVEIGVKGIIVGGINIDDLNNFLGYSLGVAITGKEDLGLTLIVTEGFGKMNMSTKTFELLKKYEGKTACIDGSTQVRAGVIRPEIIIPRDVDLSASAFQKIKDAARIPEGGLGPGSPVRLITEPNFGAIGKVVRLIDAPTRIETESWVRVLEVQLSDGSLIILPRADVELIEE